MWAGSIASAAQTSDNAGIPFLRLESRLRSVGDLLQDVPNNEVLCVLDMETWPYHWFTTHASVNLTTAPLA